MDFPRFGSGVGGGKPVPGGIPGIPGFQHRFPQFQPIGQNPTTPPPESTTSTCRTATGNPGKCVQVRQCYPLLFSSSQDELGYSGLASSLRESTGTCNAKPSFPFFYAISGEVLMGFQLNFK